ncbi:hypothetical protein Tco_0327028, partial [Tanacetum coccineum]
VDEDYHSIKDDTPLVSVYTTRNVLVRGMLIPDAFVTEEIRATDDLKEYETVFVGVDVPMNQSQLVKIERERDEVAEATILSLTLHKTTLAAESQENITKAQEKLDEVEIEKMVEGDKDEESYASEFADSMINDDVDDSGTRLESESHKEHLEIVNDDDDQIEKENNNEEIEKENKDDEIEKEKKHDDDEKIDEVVMEKDNDDDVEKVDKGVKEKCNADVEMGSMEFRKEKMETLIPTPIRSPRKVSTFDKTVIEELADTISPTTATTSKDLSTSKCKKRPILYKTKILLGITKDREVDPINAQEMISKEFSTHAPKMIEELFRKRMHHTTLNLYPTTSSSNTRKSIADLQQRLYLTMKTTPQDQAVDLEL